jgi:hypothetical protein
MKLSETGAIGGPGWADVDACTLPTVERPLRVAEFDELFTATQAIERPAPTRARLLLAGDETFADRAQGLADAENLCCSFFTFGVSMVEDGLVALDIELPEMYADVLAALVARAEHALAAAS